MIYFLIKGMFYLILDIENADQQKWSRVYHRSLRYKKLYILEHKKTAFL